MLLQLPKDCLNEILKYLNTCDRLLLSLTASSLRTCNSKLVSADVIPTLSICQFLATYNLANQQHLVIAAAKAGYLESLMWLKNNGWFCYDITYNYAAEEGHLAIIKWLRQEGCTWNLYTCSAAACAGQLEVLKYLRQEGCPWNENTCVYAARLGRLEVLKWLVANGCPLDKQRCINITTNQAIISWLQSQ